MPIGFLRRMLLRIAKLAPHVVVALFAIAAYSADVSDQAARVGRDVGYAAEATSGLEDTGSAQAGSVSDSRRLPERPPFGASRRVFSRLSTRAHSARSVTTALESVEARPSSAGVQAGFLSARPDQRRVLGASRPLAQPRAPPRAA